MINGLLCYVFKSLTGLWFHLKLRYSSKTVIVILKAWLASGLVLLIDGWCSSIYLYMINGWQTEIMWRQPDFDFCFQSPSGWLLDLKWKPLNFDAGTLCPVSGNGTIILVRKLQPSSSPILKDPRVLFFV